MHAATRSGRGWRKLRILSRSKTGSAYGHRLAIVATGRDSQPCRTRLELDLQGPVGIGLGVCCKESSRIRMLSVTEDAGHRAQLDDLRGT